MKYSILAILISFVTFNVQAEERLPTAFNVAGTFSMSGAFEMSVVDHGALDQRISTIGIHPIIGYMVIDQLQINLSYFNNEIDVTKAGERVTNNLETGVSLGMNYYFDFLSTHYFFHF